MRVDLLLCRLRFVKTRSRAQQLAESGQIRCNGLRILRPSHAIAIGDVLTIPGPAGVIVAAIIALPERRGPPLEARSHYRELDRHGETAIAGGEGPILKGNVSP